MTSPKRLRLLQALAAFGSLAVLASGIVVIVTSEPGEASRSARLQVIEGGVEGRTAGSTAFQTAPDGVPLSAGDAIRTGTGARAAISYFEGSVTTLDASTTVELQEMASATDPDGALITLRQPVGRTYHRFEGEGPGDRLRVMTPASIVTARGSEFTVTVDAGGSTAFWALEDDLGVLTLGGTMTVEEGEGLVVSSGGVPGQPTQLTSEQVADPWLLTARCEAEDPEDEACPSIEVPGEIGLTPGVAPSITPPVVPTPSLSPGMIPTPPPLTPSPTPTRGRPGSPRPSPTTPPPAVAPEGVPQTRITAAPGRDANEAISSFSFASTPGGADFQCRIDGGAWSGCSSPRSYDSLREGRHRFGVRAISSGGRADPTPATYEWRIDRTRPESVIQDGPSSTTSSAQVTFRFRATEAAVTFHCKLDGGPFRQCRSPVTYQVEAGGSHTFQVRATDRAGNIELTPAARTWHKN